MLVSRRKAWTPRPRVVPEGTAALLVPGDLYKLGMRGPVGEAVIWKQGPPRASGPRTIEESRTVLGEFRQTSALAPKLIMPLQRYELNGAPHPLK